MEIRAISPDDIARYFEGIDRREEIRAAWMRGDDGERYLDFVYLDIDGYGNASAQCIETLRRLSGCGGVYGAFIDGEIAGMASVLYDAGEPGANRLVSIDVSRNYRCHGIGRRLVESCRLDRFGRPCRKLLVRSNPHENTVRFLKSLGFLYGAERGTALTEGIPSFPRFEFPKPFGSAVDRSIDLELDVAGAETRHHFADHVTLRELSRINCYAVARLEVSDEQSFMFGSNPVYVMACGAYEYGENHKLLVICFDTFPVGIIGYLVGGDNSVVHIEPMMVDVRFQSKGIGSRALELFCERVAEEYSARLIMLGHRSDNLAAAKTYEHAGFSLVKEADMSCYREKRL